MTMVALVMLSGTASAQNPDFLFGRPHGTVAFRSGWLYARAGSDLFSYVQQELTLQKKDFNAPHFSVDVDAPVSSRLSVIYGFDYSGSSADSEYRNFVDNNRLPITQTTELREANLSAGVRLALTPPGRAISAHAWIPSPLTPYVGAGAGALWYKFHQSGDFIDVNRGMAVVPLTTDSRGWTPSAHVFGGVDVKVLKRLYVNAEARYLWSHATLNPRSFDKFKPIDLAGMKVGAGIRYMF